MTENPTASWRSRQTALVLAAAGAFALLTLGILLTRHSRDAGGPLSIASLPPPSPGVVSTDYLGGRWRLAGVMDRRGATGIPASVGAWFQLAAGGELTAYDGVNTITGRFTTTGAGFDVTETVSTAVGYAGDDPAQRAAITGIGAMTAHPDGQPLHVIVLSEDREILNIQAGGVQLNFTRNARSTHGP